jgi:hypothetical protein
MGHSNPPPDTRPSPQASPSGRKRLTIHDLLLPFDRPIDRRRLSPVYPLAMLFVLPVLVLLPLAYLGLAGLLGWAVYLHALNNAEVITAVRGRGMLLMLALYLAPIVGGMLAVFFIVKPFLAPRPPRV